MRRPAGALQAARQRPARRKRLARLHAGGRLWRGWQRRGRRRSAGRLVGGELAGAV